MPSPATLGFVGDLVADLLDRVQDPDVRAAAYRERAASLRVLASADAAKARAAARAGQDAKARRLAARQARREHRAAILDARAQALAVD